jgi:transcription antitermination factor NusG
MSWIVARTEPSREQTARRFLELAGFSVYIPVIRERHAKGGRRLVRLRPLFPSYAFIILQNGRWWDVRWSIGVAAVIMAGDEPARLSDQIVDEIRGRERGGAIELPKCNGLKAGDQVRILAGPLQGQVGVLGALRPHERVLVLMNWLGRVELSKDAVEAI